MEVKQLNSLKDGEFVKLNKGGFGKFKGRFNHVDKYKVKGTRDGKIIFDDSGVVRFLKDYIEYFDT